MRRGIAIILLAGCSGKGTISDTTDTSDTGSDSGDTSDSAETAETSLPDDPTPFTLSVSGAYDGDLVFDQPECTWSEAAPNFRAFWRNAERDHVFVLVADILGPFAGAGTYDQTMTITDVKLQEEAGGTGYYFASDTSQGDTVSITVDHVDADQAWGEFTFSALHNDGDKVVATPIPVPIWCPEMNG